MSKLEGKIQGVMILISKYIQKQGCNSGLIEFDYDLMMNTWIDYNKSTNAFKCLSSDDGGYKGGYTFPFDVSVILERFMAENTSTYGEGYIGAEMIINTNEKTVKLFENYEIYEETGRNSVELTAQEDKSFAEVCEDYVSMNIRKVSWEISGGGDSGYIDDSAFDIQYIDNDDPNRPSDIQRSTGLEDIAYALLSRNFGGWENNEGGQGELIFSPAEGNLEISLGLNEAVQSNELVEIFEF
jgi:hypothetical protein